MALLASSIPVCLGFSLATNSKRTMQYCMERGARELKHPGSQTRLSISATLLLTELFCTRFCHHMVALFYPVARNITKVAVTAPSFCQHLYKYLQPLTC